MRKFKLLKDTPKTEAGTIFIEKAPSVDYARRYVVEEGKTDRFGLDNVESYAAEIIEGSPEWFEEIRETRDICFTIEPDTDHTSPQEQSHYLKVGGFLKLSDLRNCVKLKAYLESLVALTEEDWKRIYVQQDLRLIDGANDEYAALNDKIIKIQDSLKSWKESDNG